MVANAMVGGPEVTDPVEWGKSFLAEAEKDLADAKYVMAQRDGYDRSVVLDAASRIKRLKDPDGVVPMVAALVAHAESLAAALRLIADRGGVNECEMFTRDSCRGNDVRSDDDVLLVQDIEAILNTGMDEGLKVRSIRQLLRDFRDEGGPDDDRR